MSLFLTSGGLRYHARALRAKSRWHSFQAELESWLLKWPIENEHLLLIGPSAGYTLPGAFIKKFRMLTAFDLDPLAPVLFRLRHGANVQFHKQDMFFEGNHLALAPLRRRLEQNPTAAILFCNVLGQVPIARGLAEAQWHHYLLDLRQLLTGRRWASYHDLYTLEPFPLARHAGALADFRRSPRLQEQTGWGEVLDHGTSSPWSEGLHKTYFGWSLKARSFHLIEGLQV